MSTVKENLEKARKDAKSLFDRLEKNMAEENAARRTEVADAAERASQLALSVKSLAEGQPADAKQHLREAATELEWIATNAKKIEHASKEQVAEARTEMHDHTREALNHITHAIERGRSKTM